MKCIAIDDEPKALEVIAFHCEKVPFIELIGNFRDPLDAIAFMKNEQVDLIFLDINMPTVTGMQFLNLLKHQPLVVFVTAYSEYALQSYEFEAIDYLLKPIAFDRFLKAVTKAFEKHSLLEQSQSKPDVKAASAKEEFIYIKSGPKLHKVNLQEITYLEKDGNYLIFHTAGQKVLSRQNMKHVFQLLPEADFIRVHRSFVVSLHHIDTIEAHQLSVSGVKIPIGSQYREALMERIGS